MEFGPPPPPELEVACRLQQPTEKEGEGGELICQGHGHKRISDLGLPARYSNKLDYALRDAPP